MSLIEDQPHSVTATAREDGEAMVLTRDAYLERVKNSDRVIRIILKRFSEKLRKTY